MNTELRRSLEDALGDAERELVEKDVHISKLSGALRDACDVVIWMSGSPSFSPEGEAYEGWVKQREKLYAAMAVLNGE